MPLQDIVTVDISLETTSVSQAGFGTPLFIGSHRWTNDRVATYASLTEAGVDLPADSPEYAAMQAYFGQTPSPSFVKLGRREADVTLSPVNVVVNTSVHAVTVTDGNGDVVVASYTAGAIDDEEAIVDGLKGLIDADPQVSLTVTTTKNGTGASATLTLSPTGASDTHAISTLGNLTYAFASTEVAGDVMTAITTIDDDFYFVSASDHSETFVLALAADVEARSKIYFVSLAEQGTLSALADPATEIMGKLYDLNYFRTAAMFHATADTTFPECAWIGRGAPATPGTITWSHKQLGGVAVSADPSTGSSLTSTQINYVNDRNGNFVYKVGGVSIVRTGKVVGGEWIDVIRSRDFLVAKLSEAYQNKLINAPKVGFTDSGINSLKGVCESTLSRYQSTPTEVNILEEVDAFTTNFPRAVDVSFADKSNRHLAASFKAYLAGAIHATSITGTLTLTGQ